MLIMRERSSMNVACVWVRVGVGFLGAAASAVVVGGLLGQQKMTTERVSRGWVEDQSNGNSFFSAVTPDGRYVAFNSQATNLVSGDTNPYEDIFVRDRQTGQTTRVSVASDGTQANGGSTWPQISADGRYVTFESEANNLVSGDTNGKPDIFVRDIVLGTTTRVSTSTSGAQANGAYTSRASISGDGRYVAFFSDASNLVPGDTNNLGDIFVRDMLNSTTIRASVAANGDEGNSESAQPQISADGHHVVFYSFATNLVAGDINNQVDVFEKDLSSGAVILISLASDGTQANDQCLQPSVSTDGRYVVFSSFATNLVPGDSNGYVDVFLRDVQAGTTIRTSVSSNETESNGHSSTASVSSDGRIVIFASQASNLVDGDTNSAEDVLMRDTLQGTTTRVSVSTNGAQANDSSAPGAISSDGRFLTFGSLASNLVNGDFNSKEDIFLRDLWSGTLSLVSVAMPTTRPEPNGPSAFSSYSADGRFIAFWSFATNLIRSDTNGVGDVFLQDQQTGAIELISKNTFGDQANMQCDDPSISGDGRYVAFWSLSSNLVPNDTNGKNDVFVRDRQTGTTLRVSTDSNAGQSNEISFYPKMSSNGTYVVFFSSATNLVPGDTNGFVDVFVKNIQSGATTRASLAHDGSQGNGPSLYPFVSISDDGRYVAFASDATNLVPGDTNGQPDVFVRDMVANTTTRVSVSSAGVESDGDSRYPTMTPDGKYVVFQSLATNLVSGDTNGVNDIFLRNLQTGTTTRLSVATDGTEANGASNTPSISGNGRFVAYPSVATNLVSNDTNGKSDVFRRDLVTGITSRVSVQTNGGQCDGFSTDPSVISSGSVAFRSDATNLVPGDTNGFMDVFVRRVMAFQRRGP